MIKLDRTWQLIIQGQTLKHTIQYPLTLTFDVNRQNFADLNSLSMTIYGLGTKTRNDLHYDRYRQSVFYSVELQAGYQGQSVLPTIFKGNAFVGYPDRSGADVMVNIQALDGGYGVCNSAVPPTFKVPSPWDFPSTMKTIMGTMAPHVIPGQVILSPADIAKKQGLVGRSPAFTGKTWDVLQSYCPANGQLFIDNGVCNMIGQDQVLPVSSGLLMLSDANGIVGIPKVTGFGAEISLLFEPNLNIGQQIKVNSTLSPQANNQTYKVIGLHHHGTISAVSSDVVMTDVSLWAINAPVGPGLQQVS